MTTSAVRTDHLVVESPLGELLLIASGSGVLRLAFDDENWDDEVARAAEVLASGAADETVDTADVDTDDVDTARVIVVEADPRNHLLHARNELDEYFAGRGRHFDVPVDLSPTHGFTRRALDYLRSIPYGSVTSCGQVADAIGSPGAARAVGSACSHNPVPVLVPCHRVLTTSGRIGGYLGGIGRKEYLLQLESRSIADPHSDGDTTGRESPHDRRPPP